MTFASMLADLYRRLGYQSSPAADITTRLSAYLNEGLQEVLSEPGLGDWIAANAPLPTFASVINQAQYGLPVSRIDSLTEHTNRTRLDARSQDWYRAVQPDPTTNTGIPMAWIPLGFQAVSLQPSAATGLWAASSSGADTARSVKVETVRTTGVTFSGAITLNGTTRVQLGSATDHEQVTKLYVDAIAIGTITLYDAAAAGTALGVIPIGQTFARYFGILLWPTPAAVITYYVESERDLPTMANATDEPPFPNRFHRLLVDGALWREYEKTDDTRAAAAKQRYHIGISQLRYFVTCPPDFLPSRGQQTIGRSRFGGQYPVTRQ